MTEGLSFIVGLFLPPIIEIVKTKFADNKIVSYSIAFISCIIVGFATIAIEGKLSTTSIDAVLGSVGSAMIASQAVYNYYWKPSKLGDRLETYIKKI